MDRKLNYNCRLVLKKNGLKTSNQIGMTYKTPYYFMYEKKELKRIPNAEVKKFFRMSDIYASVYVKDYIVKSEERDLTNPTKKFRFLFTQYPKFSGTFTRPRETEYRNKYMEKILPKCVKGYNFEHLTSCPMIIVRQDERKPLPLANNIGKQLDIYVSTTRQDYRQYSEQEQEQISVAPKETITTHKTMEIPKSKSHVIRAPALGGQDLEKQDKNMFDKILFKNEFKLRSLHAPLPIVPKVGLKSEYKSAYIEPSGFARKFHTL